MEFNSFFPTIVGNARYHDHDVIASSLIEHCIKVKETVSSGGQGWVSNKTYNTSNGKHDIIGDNAFQTLNVWVRQQIEIYCNNLNIDITNLQDNGSWFNIYTRYDFQETHVHPTSAISAIYILACSDDGARIFLNSPISNMYHIKKTVEKQEMVDQVICKSIPGTLVIFPSYLPHAVERHESDNLRISLSYNYKNG